MLRIIWHSVLFWVAMAIVISHSDIIFVAFPLLVSLVVADLNHVSSFAGTRSLPLFQMSTVSTRRPDLTSQWRKYKWIGTAFLIQMLSIPFRYIYTPDIDCRLDEYTKDAANLSTLYWLLKRFYGFLLDTSYRQKEVFVHWSAFLGWLGLGSIPLLSWPADAWSKNPCNSTLHTEFFW